MSTNELYVKDVGTPSPYPLLTSLAASAFPKPAIEVHVGVSISN